MKKNTYFRIFRPKYREKIVYSYSEMIAGKLDEPGFASTAIHFLLVPVQVPGRKYSCTV